MPNQHSSYINALGTAVPAYAIPQSKIAEFMADALQFDEREQRRLQTIYRQTRIEQRHSVLPDYGLRLGKFTFYPNTPGLEPFPTVGQRMAIYRTEATPLAVKAIRNCLADYPEFELRQITHLIVVSCTGLANPGPDIEILEAIDLPSTTQRLAINFMGCYGAFNGLKTADAIVRADPDAKVLVVSIELCTLHFQKRSETDHLLSNALFADGAAAVLVEAQPRAERSLRMRTFYCDLLPEGKDEMAWHVNDHGFEMTLTQEVPAVIRNGIGKLMSRLLEKSGLTIGDIGYYALHPGGRRILEVIEQQLGLEPEQNRYAYEVLRQYGNMSSATVLFVLTAIWREVLTQGTADAQPNILSCAFGPGLTLESMILEMNMTQPERVTAAASSASVPVS
ncbi:type III polyketide synthase [Nibrella saemangeumensis]|uniref:Type III polyketide synthase n=1 Tax=Nibrella saemangeumensis TaxID=1084526 RepID=A0ABP8MH98_9BACT